MILEKVYDELIGMIEDLQKKIGSAGGAAVTITPTLEAGEKIADFSIGSEEGSIYSPTFSFDYSMTEKLIGTWIDGRPLYRKTYNCGALPNSTQSNVATLTVEEVKRFYGVAINSAEGSIDARPIPMVDSASATNNIRVDVTNKILNIKTGAAWSTYNGYLTIEYTKSTDTPPTRTTKKKK